MAILAHALLKLPGLRGLSLGYNAIASLQGPMALLASLVPAQKQLKLG